MSDLVEIVRSSGKVTHPFTIQDVERLVNGIPGAILCASNLKDAVTDVLLPCDPEEPLALTLQNGVLWAQDPSIGQLSMMLKLANDLGARVRDGEMYTYRGTDNRYVHPDDQEAFRALQASAKALVKRYQKRDLQIKLSILLFFAILGVGAFMLGKLFER